MFNSCNSLKVVELKRIIYKKITIHVDERNHKIKIVFPKRASRKLRTATLGLVGSYSQHTNSDIDFLVSFRNNCETFENVMGLCHFLEQLFKANAIDIVTINGLIPHIGPKILKEVDYVKITA